MRLFIAINFDNQFINGVKQIYNQLNKSAIKGNYTILSNLHLTLAFLGETNKIDEIKKVIDSVKFAPFKLTFEKLNSFKSAAKNIVYLETKSDNLKALAEDLRNKLKIMSVNFDEKDFKAHITLIRNTTGFLPQELSIKKLSAYVDKINLMYSHRVDGVLTYTKIY